MGQYHTIYNTTKGECINLGGAKLLEKAHNLDSSIMLLVLICNSNGRGGGDFCNPIYKDSIGKKRATYVNMYTRKKSSKKEYDKIEKALSLVNGRWAGDNIVMQGDYAEKDDPSFLPITDNFKDITMLCLVAYDLVDQTKERE